eukprot:4687281-Pleurochrysis_carterae.AAC.2
MKAKSQKNKFLRWPLEKCASLADTTDTLPKSPRAAKAFADAARERVVPHDSPRPQIGKG